MNQKSATVISGNGEIAADHVGRMVQDIKAVIENMEAEIAALKLRRDSLSLAHREITHGNWQSFISESEDSLESEIEPSAPAAPQQVTRKPTPGKALAVPDAMEEVLGEEQPLHRNQIMERVRDEKGIFLNPTDPVRAISYHLSTDDRFKSVKFGKGVWALKDYVAESEEPAFTVITGSNKCTEKETIEYADNDGKSS